MHALHFFCPLTVEVDVEQAGVFGKDIILCNIANCDKSAGCPAAYLRREEG